MSTCNDDFDKSERQPTVLDLAGELPDWLKVAPGDRVPDSAGREWLQVLYREYCARLASLDSMIWHMTAILLPLGLAPYAILAGMQEPQWWRVILLAVSSVGILTFWFIPTKKSFRLQQNWLNRLMALEERLGIYKFSRTRRTEPPGRAWYQGEGVIQKAWPCMWWGNLVLWFIISLVVVVRTLWLMLVATGSLAT
jgi:hypothetical protein